MLGLLALGLAGADPGGGSWGSGPPPFGGHLNFIKRGKTSCACARKGRDLVLNSYPDPPLSQILYPPLVGVGHVHFGLFMSISFVLGTQRKHSFQWNMGFIHYTTYTILNSKKCTCIMKSCFINIQLHYK